MKVVVFAFAVLTVLAWGVDYFARVGDELREVDLLADRIDSRLAEDLDRLEREGAPPTEDVLTGLREDVHRAERSADRVEADYTGRARTWLDYLVPTRERPSTASHARLRETLSSHLATLRLTVTDAGVSPAGLGLLFPTLSEPIAAHPDTLTVQALRWALLSWFLRDLDRSELSIRSLRCEQITDEQWLTVELDGPLARLVHAYEALLAPHPAVPPRQLRVWRLDRVPQGQWPTPGPASGPPHRMTVSLAAIDPARAPEELP